MNSGEIWRINLDPTLGAEIQKTRPAIIVSSNKIGILPLKVIVPLTDWKVHYIHVPWMIKISPDSLNNLTKTSAIDTFQVRSVSEKRFVNFLGKIDNSIMLQIKDALKIVFEIE